MTTMQHRTGQCIRLFTLCLLLAGLGSGCASPPAESAALDPELDGAPAWVVRGCPGSENRICGVGSASGMQNSALRRTAAIGRARTEIARNLQVRVVALLKDYASTTAGGADFRRTPDDEQHIVDVSKQITNMTLAGTEIMDTWTSRSSTYYALVTLDVEKFNHTVGRMNQLSESVRSAVIEGSEDAFAEPEASR
jgi:hypothetical protein